MKATRLAKNLKERAAAREKLKKLPRKMTLKSIFDRLTLIEQMLGIQEDEDGQ